VFIWNSAFENCISERGGGFFIRRYDNATIFSNRFVGNQAVQSNDQIVLSGLLQSSSQLYERYVEGNNVPILYLDSANKVRSIVLLCVCFVCLVIAY